MLAYSPVGCAKRAVLIRGPPFWRIMPSANFRSRSEAETGARAARAQSCRVLFPTLFQKPHRMAGQQRCAVGQGGCIDSHPRAMDRGAFAPAAPVAWDYLPDSAFRSPPLKLLKLIGFAQRS